MKILNKTLTFMLPVVMMLGTASCSDFIEIDPENKLSEESVDFTKTSEMYQPVVGCYASVRSNAMHWVNKLLMYTRDGDVWSGRTSDQGAAVSFGGHNVSGFVYDNSFWGLNQVWMNFYQIIRTCNAALESLDGYAQYLNTSNSDYSKYEQYCGEVRTIRAWAYYNLVTNFGPVPLYKNNLQADFRRTTVKAVCDYMLNEDLAYAIDKMERKRPNQMEHNGAITAFTAEMLAAKIYLWQGDYAKVEELTDDIISNGNFELYDDYYNLFKIPGKLCDESLFECQVTDYGLGSGDEINIDQWFNFAGPSISDPESGKSLGGWNFINYETDFVNWADGRGETVRTETSFLRGGGTTKEGWVVGTGEAASTNCWNGKDYLPYEQMTEGRTTYGCNNNVRIFRYAEVLLMNSEAKIRQGKNGDSGFNEVRKRAKMPTKTGVTASDVMDERRMELCCEWGTRYNDLVRTGEAATVLGPHGWTEAKTYWPVPQTQIDNIPDLELDPTE